MSQVCHHPLATWCIGTLSGVEGPTLGMSPCTGREKEVGVAGPESTISGGRISRWSQGSDPRCVSRATQGACGSIPRNSALETCLSPLPRVLCRA